jgi:hypothetical protein
MEGCTLKDNTKIFLDALDDKVDVILEAIGIQAENYAKLMCPVDTGRLRNSITHTVSGNKGFTYDYKDNEGNSYSYNVGSARDNEKTAYIGTSVEYARAVEMGIGQRPQPYLRPAITQHNDEYKKIALTILKQ